VQLEDIDASAAATAAATIVRIHRRLASMYDPGDERFLERCSVWRSISADPPTRAPERSMLALFGVTEEEV
jgi:hypothetical protein